MNDWVYTDLLSEELMFGLEIQGSVCVYVCMCVCVYAWACDLEIEKEKGERSSV